VRIDVQGATEAEGIVRLPACQRFFPLLREQGERSGGCQGHHTRVTGRRPPFFETGRRCRAGQRPDFAFHISSPPLRDDRGACRDTFVAHGTLCGETGEAIASLSTWSCALSFLSALLCYFRSEAIGVRHRNARLTTKVGHSQRSRFAQGPPRSLHELWDREDWGTVSRSFPHGLTAP